MNENEAYEKLQELLRLADELSTSGHYGTDEIIEEVKNRLDVE
jgi:hypothetical protein